MTQENKLTAEAARHPFWVLNNRQLCDYDLLTCGGFAPLQRFLTKADYKSVLSDMRLSNGALWPIPVVLDVNKQFSDLLEPGKIITLRNQEMLPLAMLTVKEVWEPDLKKEAEAVYGTTDISHPGVRILLEETNPVYISGDIRTINPPKYIDYHELRHTPRELKKIFKQKKWDSVVAFQTRNPMHHAHIEITKSAMRQCDGKLLIHPVVGMTKPGDLNYHTRIQCYQYILPYYPRGSALLSVLPLAMRMAGPREAVWHGLIRKNYGATHFIVGRDHAGPGKDSSGKGFYGHYAAQEMFADYQDEIGVEMLTFHEVAYYPKLKKYAEVKKDDKNEKWAISGTELRKMLNDDTPIPEWFTDPKVATAVKRAYPPLKNRGFTIFFTGLSGSGKSTIAHSLISRIHELTHRNITLLDGDIVRRHLSSELGFSKSDRSLNVRRIGFVASEITKHRGIAICAPIAPYEADRRANRELISQYGAFVEVYLSTPLSVCEERDVKGLYARARQNLLEQFTGISDPYEEPRNPELTVDTSTSSVEESVATIINKLKDLAYL